MAITPGIFETQTGNQAEIHAPTPSTEPRLASATLLVCLPSMDEETLASSLDLLSATFPGEPLTVATTQPPLASPESVASWPHLHIVSYPGEHTDTDWILSAGDYAAASSLLAANPSIQTILLLGAGINPTGGATLRSLVDTIRRTSVDLVLPRYAATATDGLVNAALLYPLTRSLFGAAIRSPLPVEAVLSARMALRLAASTQRQVSLGQSANLVWPVAEAAIAGLSVREAASTSPPPQRAQQDDFNALFAAIAGSLFSDIELKANFWQRARSLTVRPPSPNLEPIQVSAEVAAQVADMVESFQLAQANLQEIWSLVMPPQSRLALKKLSTVPAAEFSFDDVLWARIVYDFTLSFHLRTLNRGHLLGAMVPLYLAWVASHLNTVGDDPARADIRIEATAAAFETEKSYLVSRWRWPDRFNP